MKFNVGDEVIIRKDILDFRDKIDAYVGMDDEMELMAGMRGIIRAVQKNYSYGVPPGEYMYRVALVDPCVFERIDYWWPTCALTKEFKLAPGVSSIRPLESEITIRRCK